MANAEEGGVREVLFVNHKTRRRKEGGKEKESGGEGGLVRAFAISSTNLGNKISKNKGYQEEEKKKKGGRGKAGLPHIPNEQAQDSDRGEKET